MSSGSALPAEAPSRSAAFSWLRRARYDLLVLGIAAVVFFGCIGSPPSLMDDVDAAHAQIARNMLRSGDWIIPHLDGVPYMEKAPLPYWLIAISFRIFGVHDWAARIPFALAALLLCWVTARYGRWAFDREAAARAALSGDGIVRRRAGFYAGLVLATGVGLFLFTRILLPDVMVALCVCTGFWSFQRALDEEDDEAHPRRWAALLAAVMGIGVMLKGLLALVVFIGGALVYLVLIRRVFRRETWRRLHIPAGVLIFFAIAAPWHILAAWRMPPHFDFSMHSGPGEYHGFFWFYFFNEHLLRFLGRRYPHDYNTVPRVAFWLLNLLWLFPWSVYLPAAAKLSFKPVDRASRTRLLALCWIGFLMLFFTFSTTQEYYSMPIYPALALLLGSAMNGDGVNGVQKRYLKVSLRVASLVAAACAIIIAGALLAIRTMPAPGDISRALQQHPDAYTLSLGHLGDLTLPAFAYLRAPLLLAGAAFLVGALGTWLWSGRRAIAALAVMMVLFFHASRLALVDFDPYLSSRTLAKSLRQTAPGQLIVDGAYYPFSSIFFYADRSALLLNGRVTNLEYGSYAPGAPAVFIDDERFAQLWSGNSRLYLVSDGSRLDALTRLAGPRGLHKIAESGGKFLFTNSNDGPGTKSVSAPQAGAGKMEAQSTAW